MASGEALDSIDGEEEPQQSSTLSGQGQAGRRTARPVARPMGVEGLGVAALSGSAGQQRLSAEELQMESDLRARLNELLVLTKEGTVDAVTGLGGLLTRDSDPGGGGGLQAGEQRVRAHRQSVYGLTREPPPWAVQPGAPTTSAKVRQPSVPNHFLYLGLTGPRARRVFRSQASRRGWVAFARGAS
jgi:hypothetical protein